MGWLKLFLKKCGGGKNKKHRVCLSFGLLVVPLQYSRFVLGYLSKWFVFMLMFKIYGGQSFLERSTYHWLKLDYLSSCQTKISQTLIKEHFLRILMFFNFFLLFKTNSITFCIDTQSLNSLSNLQILPSKNSTTAPNSRKTVNTYHVTFFQKFYNFQQIHFL